MNFILHRVQRPLTWMTHLLLKNLASHQNLPPLSPINTLMTLNFYILKNTTMRKSVLNSDRKETPFIHFTDIKRINISNQEDSGVAGIPLKIRIIFMFFKEDSYGTFLSDVVDAQKHLKDGFYLALLDSCHRHQETVCLRHVAESLKITSNRFNFFVFSLSATLMAVI